MKIKKLIKKKTVKKNPVGRPLKFTLKEFQKKITDYFEMCDEKEHPKTINGLVIALGTSRETLREYYERPIFVDTIKRAKLICENDIEIGSLKGKYNPASAIFNLKNNYGWTDRQDINLGGQKDNPLEIIDVAKLSDEERAKFIQDRINGC